MADNPDNLRVGSAGKAYVSPLGTVAPLGISTYTAGPPAVYTPITWGVGWLDLGLMSEDGLTEAVDEDREAFKPWGYNAAVRTQITRDEVTFNFTCWETNQHTLSLRHRTTAAEMVQTSPKEVKFNQTQRQDPDIRAFGFDVFDGKMAMRIVIPRGEVTERGDVVYKNDEVAGYEFTVTAYPGADGISLARYYQTGLTIV